MLSVDDRTSTFAQRNAWKTGRGEGAGVAKYVITGLDSEQVVLGWLVFTDEGTTFSSGEKMQDSIRWLEESPDTRETATVKKVLVLADELHHAAFCVEALSLDFVRRLSTVGGTES